MNGITAVIRQNQNPDQSINDQVAALKRLQAHGDVFMTVGQWHARGSNDQNALFHKLCEHIAEHWNQANPKNPTSPEQVKRDLKVSFGLIATEYSPVSGKRQARIESWANYSKTQRADLITATLAWMAENNIPDLPA